MAILLQQDINYKPRKDLDSMIEKEFEAVFTELVLKNGKKVVVGSLYRAPDSCQETFLCNFDERVNKVLYGEQKELIIGRDHNMNLPNSTKHKPTDKFLDSLLGHNMLPLTTRLTRITQHSATLIDNIFASDQLHKIFDSAILISDITDHLPTLALLKQTKLIDKKPLEFESRNLTTKKIKKIKLELMHTDWTGLLNTLDFNENFNRFHNTTQEIMDNIAPLKTFKISVRHRYMDDLRSRNC